MKKTNMLTKTISAMLAALLMLCVLAPAALAATIPDRPENKYVLDSAGVLSSSTEEAIIRKNKELFEAYGAEIAVAAVDFLGGEDIEDYTYLMFNRWGVGSSERNNGLLLVLAIGEEDYYVQSGYGFDDYFDGALLTELLIEYLEDDFAAERYDEGVEKFFNALADEVEEYYIHGEGQNDPMPEADEDDYYEDRYSEYDPYKSDRMISMMSTFIFAVVRVVVIVFVVMLVLALLRGGRGNGGGGTGGGGGGFWRGLMWGSMMSHNRRRWGAPPPPPPMGRGPMPGPGPRPGGFGGFGSPPRGGFGGRPGGFGGSSGRSGGFSSGGRSGFGGGGRSGGGGGFHGGGGSHGGGAGRR